MLRILYCGLHHDYGDPLHGDSFEHANFYDTLAHMPVEVVHFAIDDELLEHGYLAANRRLRAVVDAWKPDILFSVMFEEQMDWEVVRSISRDTDTTTVGWFCDDHWRFDSYSKYWAHALQWAVTTDASAISKYEALGAARPIKSQWACNHFSYRRTCQQTAYDVSFVGQPHGGRRDTLQWLDHRGVGVNTWGQGWPAGRIEQDEMLRVFCQSRVNLNLSASSPRGPLLRSRAATAQIKGRVFEVPGCGGLLLTEWAPGIEDYFVVGQEVVVFRNRHEMLSQIKRLLADEPARAAIAAAGYRRTLAEHTYELRLLSIFEQLGASEGELASGAQGRQFMMDQVL